MAARERETAAQAAQRWAATFPSERPEWLTERQWQVACLRVCEQLSFVAIARRLGQPQGTVRSSWLQAERRLYADLRYRESRIEFGNLS